MKISRISSQSQVSSFAESSVRPPDTVAMSPLPTVPLAMSGQPFEGYSSPGMPLRHEKSIFPIESYSTSPPTDTFNEFLLSITDPDFSVTRINSEAEREWSRSFYLKNLQIRGASSYSLIHLEAFYKTLELCTQIDMERDSEYREIASNEELHKLFVWYGQPISDSISSIIREGLASKYVLSDILINVGLVVDYSSHAMRIILLLDVLNNRDLLLRDGATLGLAYLKDPVAIPYLKATAAEEKNSILRGNIEKALSRLENSTHASSIESN